MASQFARQPQLQNRETDAVVPPPMEPLAQHSPAREFGARRHMQVRRPSQPTPSNPGAARTPAIQCGPAGSWYKYPKCIPVLHSSLPQHNTIHSHQVAYLHNASYRSQVYLDPHRLTFAPRLSATVAHLDRLNCCTYQPRALITTSPPSCVTLWLPSPLRPSLLPPPCLRASPQKSSLMVQLPLAAKPATMAPSTSKS